MMIETGRDKVVLSVKRIHSFNKTKRGEYNYDLQKS